MGRSRAVGVGLALLLVACRTGRSGAPEQVRELRRVQVAGTWVALGPDESSQDVLGPVVAKVQGRCARPPPGFPAEGISGSAPLLAPGGEAVLVSGRSSAARESLPHADLAALTTYRAPRWAEPTGAVVPIPNQGGVIWKSLAGAELWAMGTKPSEAEAKARCVGMETRLVLVAPSGQRLDLGEFDCRPPGPELVALPDGAALVLVRTPGRSEPAVLHIDARGERAPLAGLATDASQLGLRPDGETLVFVKDRNVLEAPLAEPARTRVRYDLARLPALQPGRYGPNVAPRYRIAPAGPRDLLLVARNRLGRIDAQDGLTWIAELPETVGDDELSFGAVSASADGSRIAAEVVASGQRGDLLRVRLLDCGAGGH